MSRTSDSKTFYDGSKSPLVFRVGPLLVDFTRAKWEPGLWPQSFEIYDIPGGWAKVFDKLHSGQLVNTTEKRAALHTATRGYKVPDFDAGGNPVKDLIIENDNKMKDLVERIRKSNQYENIIHVGIGGSSLGPDLVIESLSYSHDGLYEVRFLTNIDYHVFKKTIKHLRPKSTLIVVASKSWSTDETQTNLNLLREWFLDDPEARFEEQTVVVTSCPEKAAEDGFLEENTLVIGQWVGGRFSVWSPVGVTIALQYGWETFESFRKGGRLVDEHVEKAGDDPSAPVISALLGISYVDDYQSPTRAVIPYDGRLGKLVPYLQQLEMESTGKQVTANGNWYSGPTSPVVWGGIGTESQHSFFQWLHQSSSWCPVEFLMVATPDHDKMEVHNKLLSNCLAQASTLMDGHENLDNLSYHHEGNLPSTTILIDKLTAESIGSLIAFYEYRVYAMSVLMGINCFDQMGVELGKTVSRKVEPFLQGEDPFGLDQDTGSVVHNIIDMRKQI